MTEAATYFVIPSPAYGEYVKDEWLVFAVRDDQPKWWQLIARFTEECRAKLYANVENDTQVITSDLVPPDLSIPPSALEKIAASVKAGNIFAAPPVTNVIKNPQTLVVPALAELKPSKATKTKSKKTKAHFPSDKWDEPATKRLVDLRAEGKPFGEIAQILNEEFPGRGYTKSACTAKGDRLGLPKSVDTKAVDEVSLEDDWNLGRFPMEEDDVLSDVIIEEATKPEYDVSPTQVREAIHWYRSLRHVVYHYKNEGKIQVDHGAMISPAEFLALVNPERERMSLPPFVEQQEAAD